MTDRPDEKPRLENLELNQETVQDLDEGEGEHVPGGLVAGNAADGWVTTQKTACNCMTV